jgi:hypothetical protein
MPQTRPNKAIVPINADAYNLTADLATMADSLNVSIKVASQAERDALTVTAGSKVTRLDLPGAPDQTWDGSAWQGPGAATPALISLNGLYASRASLGFLDPAVVRVGGRVSLQGTAKNVSTITVNAGTAYTLGTLPTGYAPTAALRFPILWDYGNGTTSGPFVAGFIQANTNGTINYALTNTITNATAGYAVMSIDGISWFG